MKKLYLLILALFLGVSFTFADGIVVRTTPIPGVPLQKITPVKAKNIISTREIHAKKAIKRALRPYNKKPVEFTSIANKINGNSPTMKNPKSGFKKIIKELVPLTGNRGTILGPESFETAVPPSGWYQFVFSDNQSSNRWFQASDTSTTDGHDGSYVAWINYDDNNIQDCALSTPAMDLSGYTNCAVTFYLWQDSQYDDTMFVLATTDSTSWNIIDEFTQTGYNFDSVTVDLSAYDGSSHVFVAFNYYNAAPPDEDAEGIDYVTVTGNSSSSSLPDLTPYTPTGWSSSLVCSVDSTDDTTATTSDTLNAGDSSYVSMAFVNSGSGDVTDTCYFYLYVDGSATKGWYVDTLKSNYYVPIIGTKILVSSAGSHVISDTADAKHNITESNENNNGTSETYYWKGSVAGKNLTPYTPSGWDAPVVVSSVPNTHTNGPSYYSDSTSYIDWAVKNAGTEDITSSFYVYLYIDGNPINGWQINGLKADSIASISDYTSSFSAGTHSVGIFADSTNTVSETDENDNKYSNNFTFTENGQTGYTGNAEYIIITDPSFVDAFKPLAWWKTKKGVPTKIVTTDSIYNTYSGYDNAEKIRNFIIAAKDSGAQYILLGGQCDYEHNEEFVPRRNIYFMQSGAGDYPDEDTIISDMYYQNLDGTWDANGNHTYGEDDDSVDFYSDIYVGRAPVKTVAQVTNFVNKVINYEKNPPTAFLKKILLPSVQLFDQSSTGYDYYGYTVNNYIADILPSTWETAKLEDNNENATWNLRQAVIDSTNVGFEFIHHADHGNEDGFYYHQGDFVYSFHDADSASNGSKLSIINAISCFTGAMDENSEGDNGNDCVAEHFINNTNGGAVADILNSRYGLGPQQEGQMGYSEDLDTTFYDRIFKHNEYHIGEVVAHMKDQWASSASSNDAVKWCVTELNLLGDPEMPIWTDTPIHFNVTLSADSVPTGENTTVTLTITDGTKANIDNAVVAFANRSLTVYDTTHSTSGTASATLNPSTAGDTIFITITKHNYYPYETFVTTYSGTTNGITNLTKNISKKKNRIINTKNGFKLEFSGKIKGNVKIELIDLNGRIARTKNVNAVNGSAFVSERGLPSGVYFIKLHNNTVNKTFKVNVIK